MWCLLGVDRPPALGDEAFAEQKDQDLVNRDLVAERAGITIVAGEDGAPPHPANAVPDALLTGCPSCESPIYTPPAPLLGD